ncbi:MAG TPA: farnesyl diphosphate synthase [Candidatus Limnocylindria bacterium]|nr:farnesyl diphosphate synthase [Candidatus Limnocylindria bacterium]
MSPSRAAAPSGMRASAGALAVRRRAFERYFQRVLPPASQTPSRLHAAMRYGALSPGKRLRPLLVLTACEAVGGRWTTALPAAAAVECIHAYSLIHDDLPAMDDDDFRRGRPTTHRKFGEAVAILAGDALLALAFRELSRAAERRVSDARVIEAVRILAGASGSQYLVGGQAMDLEAEGRAVKLERVTEIHLRKTGGLISASLKLGGLIGGANRAALRRFDKLGHDLGFAFQVQDDLLNRTSSLRKLGKRSQTDAKRGKATVPAVAGEVAARLLLDALFTNAIEDAQLFGRHGRNLERLIQVVAARDH